MKNIKGNQLIKVPVARKHRANYENIIVTCPCCGKENIFNRVTDLCTTQPIAGKNVNCLNNKCGKPFRIVGDIVNPPHELLIFDCYEFIARKQYIHCIISLSQAYEVFFNQYFLAELLYKPFSRDRKLNILNQLLETMENKFKKYTFDSMRSLFLYYITTFKPPINLTEAERIIKCLPDKPKKIKDTEIQRFGDKKLVPLLLKVKKSTINELRNNVIHKKAYRPTREEAENAFEETKANLLPLTWHLKLYRNINMGIIICN